MKKRENIRDFLGLTQLEMAMILNMGRNHYTMFELGTRRLPAAATVLLSEMLQYVQTAQIPAHVMQQQYTKSQHELERMLKENEYQQLAIARKIKATEKVYNAKLKALQLVEFLTQRNANNGIVETAVLKSIEFNATKSLYNCNLASLSKLKLKLELLTLEKIMLDAELRKLTLTTDFISNKKE